MSAPHPTRKAVYAMIEGMIRDNKSVDKTCLAKAARALVPDLGLHEVKTLVNLAWAEVRLERLEERLERLEKYADLPEEALEGPGHAIGSIVVRVTTKSVPLSLCGEVWKLVWEAEDGDESYPQSIWVCSDIQL